MTPPKTAETDPSEESKTDFRSEEKRSGIGKRVGSRHNLQQE